MLILLHVLLALAGVCYSSLALIAPAKASFKLSYVLVGATLASGTVLAVVSHARLLSTCISGLAYISLVSAILVGAHFRLTTIKAKN